jgi:hypothetical protein
MSFFEEFFFVEITRLFVETAPLHHKRRPPITGGEAGLQAKRKTPPNYKHL